MNGAAAVIRNQFSMASDASLIQPVSSSSRLDWDSSSDKKVP